jgi:HEAT repeat protein
VKTVLPALLRTLDDPDPELHTCIALAVLRADPAHGPARGQLRREVATLIDFLESSRRLPQKPTSARAAALWLAALELLGSEARSAVPLLKRLAEKDPDKVVRQRAAQALKTIDTPARKPVSGSD